VRTVSHRPALATGFLLAAALLGLSAAGAPPAPDRLGGYDAFVDLDAGLLYQRDGVVTEAEAGNPCKLMQRALNPILARSTPHTPPPNPKGRVAHRSVRISGRAVIDPSDLTEVPFCAGGDGCRAGGDDGVDTTSSDLDICVGIYGSTQGKAGHRDPDGLANGYPIVDNTPLEGGLVSGFLDLNWDGVVLEYDGAKQSKAAALIYQGACWLEGASYAGQCSEDPAKTCEDDGDCSGTCRDVVETHGCAAHVNDFLTESGSLKVVYTGESDGGAPPSGTMAMRERGDAGPFWTPTTAVAIWNDGMLRGQLGGLSVILHGRLHDDDDIGLLHRFAWGRYRRGWRIWGFGIGVLYYGNAVGSLAQSYVSGNDVGVSFGDWEDGGDLRWFSRCVSGHCEMFDTAAGNSQYVTDSIIEGNPNGNIVIWEGGAQYFRGIYTENGGSPGDMAGHSIVLGPGRCKAEQPPRICAFDSDCGRGTCDSDFDHPRTLKTVEIDGKLDWDHKNPRWDAVAIGKFFAGSDGYVKLSGRLGESWDGRHFVAFTAPPPAARGPEVPIDLSDAVFEQGKIEGLPAYGNVVHAGAVLVPFASDALPQPLQLPAAGMAGAAYAVSRLEIDAPPSGLLRASSSRCRVALCRARGPGRACEPIAEPLGDVSAARGAAARQVFDSLSIGPRTNAALELESLESTPGACRGAGLSGTLTLIPLPALNR